MFDDGTSVDIRVERDHGSVSGRQIIDNKFDYSSYGGDNWPAISFNGSGTTVPWYANTVGGAEITGNTFVGAEVVYIRSRGNCESTPSSTGSRTGATTRTTRRRLR